MNSTAPICQFPGIPFPVICQFAGTMKILPPAGVGENGSPVVGKSFSHAFLEPAIAMW